MNKRKKLEQLEKKLNSSAITEAEFEERKQNIFRKSKRNTWISICVLFLLFYSNSVIKSRNIQKIEEQERISKEENIAELLKNKVRIPDTLFETQESVKIKFEAAGLNAHFVVSNFDGKATVNRRYLRAGECDAVDSSQVSVSYFGWDELGIELFCNTEFCKNLKNKIGMYADKGATVIVGYSDHDFDGKAEAEKKDKKTEEEAKPEDDNKLTSLPSEISNKVDELNMKYDNIISKAHGYVDNPSTYTMSAYLQFTTEYTDIISDYGELAEILEKYDNFSSWEEYDIWMSILNKNSQLLIVLTELPEIYG